MTKQVMPVDYNILQKLKLSLYFSKDNIRKGDKWDEKGERHL